MTHSAQTLLGSAGVALLLLAFFLNLFRLLSSESRAYASLNLVGAALACASSWMIGFVPFVVLEGVWALVAGIALLRGPQQRVDAPDRRP